MMMKLQGFKRLLSMGALALCAFSSACAPAEEPPPGEFITSDKARVTKPDASAEDVASLVEGNTDFGASLYRQLREPGRNLIFSPYSITQALAMVYAGARGTTEAQLSQGLHFSLPQARLHPAMNALSLALDTPSGNTSPAARSQLLRVNAFWSEKGLPFEPDFLDVLAQHYGSGMHVVDFVHDFAPVREGINAWVARQTQSHIQDLLPPGSLDEDTKFVLVNALYFKGKWSSPFDKRFTQDAPFHPLVGEPLTVPMMEGGSGMFMRGEGFQALALDYAGQDFRMLVIVPDTGRFEDVEARLSARLLQDIREGLAQSGLDVHLPKFQMDTQAALIPALQALGIEDAFDARADLSGITLADALHLSAVEHKAFVTVDEQGTEAAAATAGVGAGATAVLPEPFIVDRPFLFVIEHVPTRSVLFLGRYVSP